MLVAHSRCPSQSLEGLFGVAADDVGEDEISLSPSFLDELYPYLVLCGVGELPGASLLADSEVIVNLYIQFSPIDEQSHHISASIVEAWTSDNSSDPIFELSQRSHSRQKVAVTQLALYDVIRLNIVEDG